jgi:hypothetical protein
MITWWYVKQYVGFKMLITLIEKKTEQMYYENNDMNTYQRSMCTCLMDTATDPKKSPRCRFHQTTGHSFKRRKLEREK